MPPEPTSTPPWERRFRAPTVMFPRWARHAPDRLAVTTNETGAFQVYAWDRARRTRRRVTDHPIGIVDALATPDGDGVVWFHDESGSEVGQWVFEPFRGDARERRPLVEGVPDAWSAGLALGDGLTIVGTADEKGFAVHVAKGDGPATLMHQGEWFLEVTGISRDDALVCLEHAEHGDVLRRALRVVDPTTGEVVGEQWDGDGLGLRAGPWSPVPGDRRLAIVHEREGRLRPGVWDLGNGDRFDLLLDLPGDVSVAGWWPDGSALLLLHEHDGRSELLHCDPAAAPSARRVRHPDGTIMGAGVRPDGEVWYRVSSGAQAASIRSDRDGHGDVIVPEGDRAPDGVPYRSIRFTNPRGDEVHGFLATPPGPGPHPIVMDVHGGPTWQYSDDFSPATQAWVDHGYAVAKVNYRGSVGYGTAFRDALIGDPGFPEVEDVVAGLEALVADGVADPTRAILAGASWGGYITLLGLGLHPDRWAAGLAGVPVADYVAAYQDEAPGLQAFDSSLFGGSPEDVPDLYRERSPLTYVDRVVAPVLILAGDNDTRCPIRQILNYVERLEARGATFDVYRFDAGHGSLVVAERIRQMAAQLAFVQDHVPG